MLPESEQPLFRELCTRYDEGEKLRSYIYPDNTIRVIPPGYEGKCFTFHPDIWCPFPLSPTVTSDTTFMDVLGDLYDSTKAGWSFLGGSRSSLQVNQTVYNPHSINPAAVDVWMPLEAYARLHNYSVPRISYWYIHHSGVLRAITPTNEMINVPLTESFYDIVHRDNLQSVPDSADLVPWPYNEGYRIHKQSIDDADKNNLKTSSPREVLDTALNITKALGGN